MKPPKINLNKKYYVSKKLIESHHNYEVYHFTGVEKFRGCQCLKDCSCSEDFKEVEFSFYSVKKLINKPKTTHHNTLEEVKERTEFLKALTDTKNKKYIKNDLTAD